MRVPRFTPWLLVVTLTAAGAAAALGYGLTAPKRYRATAQILATPVSGTDSTFAGLDVLRDVAGKQTAGASAAALVRSPQVADAVRAQLGLRRSRDALLDELHAHVVGKSDVVDVDVRDTSAAAAAQIANAFVDALMAQRTTSFQSQLVSSVRRTEQLLSTTVKGPQATELARRLAVLRSLQGQPDPTLRRASTATAPTGAVWPVLWSLVLIGAAIGLAAGAIGYLVLALARRRDAGAVPQYSRAVSSNDPAVDALVERLEQRLAARESALAARERDLQAKIDELRAIERGAPAASVPDAAREADIEAREQALAARVEAVTKRELAVARAAASTPAGEAVPAKEAELAAREQALAERVEAVTQRELAIARAAAARPAPVAPAAEAPAPVRAPGGSFNLATLERLVAEQGPAHPDRRDEWDSTLFFLRDYADPDGTLPGSFDFLVADTFQPLLR